MDYPTGKVKPVTPAKAAKLKAVVFPDFVIESFNEEIAKKMVNGYAKVGQEQVMATMVLKMIELHTIGPFSERQAKEKIIEEHWLDVEDLYRANGWTVSFDQPGYNESYPASFTFKKKA